MCLCVVKAVVRLCAWVGTGLNRASETITACADMQHYRGAAPGLVYLQGQTFCSITLPASFSTVQSNGFSFKLPEYQSFVISFMVGAGWFYGSSSAPHERPAAAAPPLLSFHRLSDLSTSAKLSYKQQIHAAVVRFKAVPITVVSADQEGASPLPTARAAAQT